MMFFEWNKLIDNFWWSFGEERKDAFFSSNIISNSYTQQMPKDKGGKVPNAL